MTIYRACITCGKPALGSYCSRHKPKPWGSSKRRRGMAISGGRWATIRKQVLVRDLTVCYLCDQPGADEVDHLIPVAAGGSNDLINLASAHSACHKRRHMEPAWAMPRIEMARAVLSP